MATDQIDNVIGYLIELKKLKSHLELKDEEIRKYVDLLLTKKLNDYDQSFMIYSYDTDEEAINIIGRHLMEFSEMIYDHNYMMIAKKEVNRNLGIYLMPFGDCCSLETTLEAIEELIEIKRQELDNESSSVQSKRIVPAVKMITYKMAEMVDKMGVSDETTKRMSKKLEEKMSTNMSKMDEKIKCLDNKMEKLDDVNMQINDVKSEMEIYSYQMKSMLDQLCNEMYHLKVELVQDKDYKIQCFYTQKNLKYIRNSSKILEKMCMRLSVKNNGDDSRREPPLKDILSMEDKKKELIEYFEFLQKNLDGSTEETEIQINIREWMAFNWPQLVYKPTTSEKEEWKKEMEQMLKVKNTIGTVGYIAYKFEGKDSDFFFCIANSKIICLSCGYTEENVLKNLQNYLKNVVKWDTNAKFATDVEVSDDLSDYFVHVSTDEIMKISNNQKVIEWMTNNFESLKYSFKERYHHSISSIYNMALKYFEESIK